MAYFPNGTAGAIFVAGNCDYCSQWKERADDYPGDGEGCPVWDAHFLYQEHGNEKITGLLDLLIQDTPQGPRCNIFTPISEPLALEREGQISFDEIGLNAAAAVDAPTDPDRETSGGRGGRGA